MVHWSFVRLPMENFSSVPSNVICCAGIKSKQIFHWAPGKLSSAALTVSAEPGVGILSSSPSEVSTVLQLRRSRGRYPFSRNCEICSFKLRPVSVHAHHNPVCEEQGLPAAKVVGVSRELRRSFNRPSERVLGAFEQERFLTIRECKQRVTVESNIAIIIREVAKQPGKHLGLSGISLAVDLILGRSGVAWINSSRTGPIVTLSDLGWVAVSAIPIHV